MTAHKTTVSFVFEGVPDRGALEDLLNQLATVNAGWYLRQWARGESPPETSASAAISWHPDPVGHSAAFEMAPIIIDRGWASCGPIVALDVGALRARDIVRGTAPTRANQTHRVRLRPTGRPNEYHAVRVNTRTATIDDPSIRLQAGAQAS